MPPRAVVPGRAAEPGIENDRCVKLLDGQRFWVGAPGGPFGSGLACGAPGMTARVIRYGVSILRQ